MKKTIGWGLLLLIQISWAAPPPDRIFHFPAEYSLGELYIQDDSDLQNALWFNPFNDVGCWNMLAQASGDVRIPAGKRVKLIVASKAWQKPEHLAPLKGLNPNDLYALDLGNVWPPDKPATDKCIPYIRHLTGLRQLNLFDSVISQDGLKELAGMEHLERIRAPMHITNGGLGTLLQMKSLTSIQIVGRFTDRAMSFLFKLPHLKELNLVGNRLTDEGLSHLQKLPHLEYLYLSAEKDIFSPEGYAHIAKIPNLRNMWINTKKCNDEKISQLAHHPTLEGLSLHWESGITDQGIQSISQIPNLKRLDVSSAKLTDQSMHVLSMCRQLEILKLPGTGITDAGIQRLSGLVHLKELKVSTASNSPLTDKSLAELTMLQNLEKLWIAGNGFTDAGMDCLLRLQKMKELLLGSCPSVTNDGFAKLAKLENLEILYWRGESDITFDGLNQFGGHKGLKRFKCTNVRREGITLDLSGMENLENLQIEMPREYKKDYTSTFTDSFVDDDLACLAALKNLNSIQLYGDGIGDKGLGYLKDLNRLDTLFLYGRSTITDEGLQNLSGLNRLWQLHIKNGHFTEKALEILAEMDSLSLIELRSDAAISDQAIQEFKVKKKSLKKWNVTVSEKKQ